MELVVRDKMNSICPINFFRTTDTTDTMIWKPGFKEGCLSPAGLICRSQVAGRRLQVAGGRLQVAGSRLQVAGRRSRVAGCRLNN